MHPPTLHVLYTAIGRGHPYYLDGVVETLARDYSNVIQLNVTNVFSLSHGLSLKLWQTVRAMYRQGGKKGIRQALYGIMRNDSSPFRYSLGARLLAPGLRKFLAGHPGPTLVGHPLLVPMIRDLVPVYYQHGEVTAPLQSAVSGSRKIFVPIDACRTRFVQHGIPASSLETTGLCIERELALSGRDYYENRIYRLEHGPQLTGAFYSSGAEPDRHVRDICAGARSLLQAGHQPLVYCAAGGKLEGLLSNMPEAFRILPDQDGFSYEKVLKEQKILVIIYSGRENLDRLTLALFKCFDFIVAPSHERTNWAIGLGLPLFILHPVIGPFAPLNRQVMLDQDVACDLLAPDTLGETVAAMHAEQRLLTMARNGWGKYNINGFASVARFITTELGQA